MPVRVTVTGVGLRKVAAGSSIVYRKWVRASSSLRAGRLVEAVDESGRPVACALWEPVGPVALRVLARGQCPWREAGEAVRDLVRLAYEARRRLGILRFNSYRLVNSDGDRLSGLVVDVYSDVAVVQSSSAAVDAVLGDVVDSLVEVAGVEHVYNKSTQRSRRDIGLEPVRGWLRGRRERVVIEEGPARFIVDVVRGQKTGFFLDQRPNRLELHRLPLEGARVLDVFAYTGAFGIHAYLAGAREVVFIEEDPLALELLKENARLNGVERYKVVAGSLWDHMDVVEPAGFELVTVDPPAFIQSPEQVERGLKAYEASYHWALARAADGAVVYLSSCSYFLKRDMFLAVISRAAARAGVEYRIAGSLRGAGPDHALRGEEYLDYLKGAFMHVERIHAGRRG